MQAPLSLTLTCLGLMGCVAPSSAFQDRLAAWDRLQDDFHAAESEPLVELGPGAGLPELLHYARLNNPGVRAAFEHWKAALEQVPQMTGLPNPRLTLASYLSEVETRVGPIRGSIGLAQPFPWFGKRGLAGEVAFEASEAARQLLEAARLDLDRRLRDAWYEYAWVEQAIEITEGNRDLLTHYESVARSRMATGLSSHADVIRSQVELGKLEDRVQTLMDLRRPLIARLNAALNRATDAPVPKPSAPLPEPPAIDGQELLGSLAKSNPLLKALAHRVESAELGIDLAGKAYYPDFFVGLDYTLIGSAVNPSVSGSGDDAIALKLGFDLPIWRSKYRAGVRASEARARGARLELQNKLNQLRSELEMALYRVRDADRRVSLFEGSLVPKGEESIQALDTAYRSGDEGFLDLIDAQRVLLEFQLQAARASSDRAQALAEVEGITGIHLNLE